MMRYVVFVSYFSNKAYNGSYNLSDAHVCAYGNNCRFAYIVKLPEAAKSRDISWFPLLFEESAEIAHLQGYFPKIKAGL
jgi:hypothetical protein